MSDTAKYTEHYEQMQKENAELLETLAAGEHRQWAHWTRHLLDELVDKYDLLEDGLALGDLEEFEFRELVLRWKRQCETKYHELPENEKRSDREAAMQAIDRIRKAGWILLSPTEFARITSGLSKGQPVIYVADPEMVEKISSEIARAGRSDVVTGPPKLPNAVKMQLEKTSAEAHDALKRDPK